MRFLIINSKIMPKKITLEKLAEITQNEFNKMGEKIETMGGKMDKEFKEIKNEMVTKSYFEDKLADLEGGVIVR